MLRTWGTIALLNDNISSSSKWLIKCCCVTGLCISIKEPYWKTANSAAHVRLSEDCEYLILGVWWGGESHRLNRVVQTTRNLFSKLLNVGTSCEEWFKLDTLFPSLGLILLLHLVSGIRASKQPCYYYSWSFPSSRVCMALSVCSEITAEGRRTYSFMWWSQRLLQVHFTLGIAIGTILEHYKKLLLFKLPKKFDIGKMFLVMDV